MNCAGCGKLITYDPNETVTYFTLTTYEMVWGEHCVYPAETHKALVCSLACLNDLADRETKRVPT